MLSNFNIKILNDIKNMRADEYSYDKFLQDSSDDYPKYSDGLERLKSQTEEEGNSDDSLERPSSTLPLKDIEDLKISIHNVLELAQEGIKTMSECDSDKEIAQKSLDMVKDFLGDLKDSNIELAKADSD